MAAVIAVAFGAGYWGTKASGGSRGSDGGFHNRSSISSDKASAESGSRKFTGIPWQEAKARVIKRWEASPSVVLDFDLNEQTLRLLEKAPVAELEVWMRELRPMDHADWNENIPSLLRQMIIKVLVERSGVEFIRSLARNPVEDEGFDLDEIMHYWTEHDPLAVLEWLDGGNLPEAIAEDVDYHKEVALEKLSGKDPVEFERRLAAVDAEARESILETYAYRRGTSEHRAGLLERAAGSPHGEAMALYQGLLRRESKHDLRQAIATLQDLGVSTEDRATLDVRLVSGLMNDSRFDGLVEDKSPVLQSWIERNPERRVPSVILEEFNDWSMIDSERAVAWLAKLNSGFQHDDLAKRLVYERTRSEDVDLTELLGIAARIGDFNIRAEANRRIKKAWKPDDAAIVAEWEKNLPEKDRERLKRDVPGQ